MKYFILGASMVIVQAPPPFVFDVCAAGEPYTAIKYVKTPRCSGCTKYLLCVGFRNAVAKCDKPGNTASATATLISTTNTNIDGNFFDYMQKYLNAAYDSEAVLSGLNGDDCLALYGSSLGCTVSIFRSTRRRHPFLDPSDDIIIPLPSCHLPITLL